MNPAERGGTFLDVQNPGWYNRIDCASLDIGSGQHCVLGQLYGNFIKGLYALRLFNDGGSILDHIADYGFGSHVAFNDHDRFGQLNEQWREVIAKRRLSTVTPEVVIPEVVSTLA